MEMVQFHPTGLLAGRSTAFFAGAKDPLAAAFFAIIFARFAFELDALFPSTPFVWTTPCLTLLAVRAALLSRRTATWALSDLGLRTWRQWRR
jgi:hypothetical protein